LLWWTIFFRLAAWFRRLTVRKDSLLVPTLALPIDTLLVRRTLVIRPTGRALAVRQLTPVVTLALFIFAHLPIWTVAILFAACLPAVGHLGLRIAADALVLDAGLQLGAPVAGIWRLAVWQPFLCIPAAALAVLADLRRRAFLVPAARLSPAVRQLRLVILARAEPIHALLPVGTIACGLAGFFAFLRLEIVVLADAALVDAFLQLGAVIAARRIITGRTALAASTYTFPILAHSVRCIQLLSASHSYG
jgi:hypothetical protein